MLKNTLIAGCATLSFVACAHGPTSQSELNTTTDQVSPRTQCLTTGTHIRLESGKCALAPGRVYSQEDIELTGAFDVAEALRRLDPAVSPEPEYSTRVK